MKRILAAVALAVALPMSGSPALFASYEAAREGLLKSALKDVQSAARALSAEASRTKNPQIAKQADAVATSTDLSKARIAFAALSDDMIKLREGVTGTRPAVYYCSMVKKSWLQPKGQVGNPYEPGMAMCGELKAEGRHSRVGDTTEAQRRTEGVENFRPSSTPFVLLCVSVVKRFS